MSNSLFLEGKQNELAVFDLFFRRVPEDGGYAIFAGLEAVCEYINDLEFTKQQIDYIKANFDFCDDYINALKNFKFSCSIKSVPEGTPIFPNEPIMRVEGPVWQAMLIEVALLNTVGHQSLIATKAARVVRAAEGRDVLEFGARRSQGEAGAVWGARAAYIGGASGVSVVEAGARFSVPVSGTMAHSFVQSFGDDFSAFSAYAKAFPKASTFLLDTYDTLKSGLPAAIKAQKEVLEPLGEKLKAVRIDSGDLGYLAKKIREELDKNGMEHVKIIASNALDENKIRDLIADQKAPIDIFGVGENLITSSREPIFSGVYKLAEIAGKPCMKFSENPEKMTTPGRKEVYRMFDENGKAMADVVCLEGEEIASPYLLFSPEDPLKNKTVEKFVAKKLLQDIYINGVQVYDLPDVMLVREYCATQKETIWEEVKRFNAPHRYYVDLSQKLYDMREKMRKEQTKRA